MDKDFTIPLRSLRQAGRTNRDAKQSGGWAGGGAGLLFTGFGALVLRDDRVLEMDRGDDCATMAVT